MKVGIPVAIALAILFLCAPTGVVTQESKKEVQFERPRVVGLLFYADWCNSCKILEPKLNQVKREFQDKSMLFTRFDMTDEFTKDQSAHFAALLGMENHYRENDGKTGFMLLVEERSKKVLGKITKEKSADDIRSILSLALTGAHFDR